MKKTRVSKIKHKRRYVDESNEEEEEEENEYVEDGFLVPDNENESRGYTPFMNPEADPRAPEAEIESDFASSDYDIMEEKREKKSRKLKKGMRGASEIEEKETMVKEKRRNRYMSREEIDRDDIDNFIERDERREEYSDEERYVRKGPPKSMAHNIFSLTEQEEGEEIVEEKKADINQLSKIYDVEEIEGAYATKRDNIIKILDYPERLLRQYTEEQLATLSKDVDMEADWILDRLKSFNSNLENIQSLKKKITLVLEYHKKELLDIPFIVFYKKTYEPELNSKEVWNIFEMDKEWTKLVEYKNSVKKQFETVIKFLDNKKAEFIHLRYIDNAKSIRELKDMEVFIHFLKEYNKNAVTESTDQYVTHLRPQKRSLLQTLRENKIDEFTKEFTLSSHDLAINLDLIASGDTISRGRLLLPPEPSVDPSHLSYKYVNNQYDEEMKILTNACKFLGIELYAHPYIRMYARNFFKLNSYLSTDPTEEGKKELDVFHPSYRVKRIKKKPVDNFNNDLFLDIVQCESKGLITVKIECDEELKSEFSERLIAAYDPKGIVSDDPSSLSNKWRIMKEEVVRVLVVENIFPDFIKEIRAELLERAENFIIKESSDYFYNLLNTGPYKKQRSYQYSSQDIYNQEEDTPKVMSFVFDSSKNETYCAMLDQFGEVIDYHIFNHLASKPIRILKPEDKQIYYEDQAKLKDMIDKYKPDLIVIGANDLKCRYLRDQIMGADPDIMKNQEESGSTWLTFGDLTVPRLFANSPLAEKKMKNFNLFLKQAISLGRFKQNPLAEILQLWNEDTNKNMCLSLPMHPLQKSINQNKLAEYLELKAIEVSNNVGVDINLVFEHPHLRGPLSFISGLGPRKASYIMDRLISNEGLSMRIQLIIQDIIGKKVFMNCAAFLKIKPNIYKDMKFDLLDMTRIHPEFYPMANKLAKSAAEGEIVNENHVELCMKDPKKFNALELKGFIKKHEEKGPNTNIKAIIALIISEFQNRFKDPRLPHKDLTPSELFHMLVGDENIRVGHMVIAKVTKVEKEHVKCRLLNDLEATVWVKDIYEEDQYDRNKEFEMKEKYKEGMMFEARIKQINENSFKIDLSTKPSVLASHKNFMQVNLDKWFIVTEDDYENKNYQAEVKAEHKKYIPRNIKHPAFKNITYYTAVEQLRSKDIGDYIFRPSSKGVNFITLSWKFYRHTYAHVMIQEEEKLPGAAIGSKLKIGNDVYQSLNEIIERYIKPCERLTREVLNSRKFCHFDSMEEFEARIKSDKVNDPSIVNYLLTIISDYPQYVILGYANKINSVFKEFIRVKPRGYYFHEEYFSSIEDLIIWFKKNFAKESYREYAKRARPPIVEERRKLNDSNEFSQLADYLPPDQASNVFSQGMQDTSNYNSGGNFNNTNANFARTSSFTSSNPSASGNRTCNQCGQTGHYRRDCPQNKDKFINNKRDRSQVADYGRDSGFKERKVENESWAPGSESANPSATWGSSEMQVDSGWGVDTGAISNNANNTASNWGNQNQTSSSENTNSAWGNTDNTNANKEKASTTENMAWNSQDNNATSVPWGNNNKSNDDNRGSWNNNNNSERDSNRNKRDSNNFRGGRGDRGRGRGDRGRGGGGFRDRNNNDRRPQSPDGEGFKSPQNEGWNVGSSSNNENTSGWGQTSNNNNTTSNDNVEMTSGSNWGANTTVAWGSGDSTEKTSENNNAPWGTTDSSNDKKDAEGTRGVSTSTWGNNEGGDVKNNNNFYKKDNYYQGGNKKKSCFNCGEEGHMSSTCPHPKKERGGDRKKSCFNCGEEGHMSSTCPHPKKERGGDRKKGCFNCGEEGHMSSTCPHPKKERGGDRNDRGGDRKKSCYNCGEEGHMSSTCPHPKKERGGDRGRGRGRGGRDFRSPRSDEEFKSPSSDEWGAGNSNSVNSGWNTSSGWNNVDSNNNQTTSNEATGWGANNSNTDNNLSTVPGNDSNTGAWGANTEGPGTWGASDNNTAGW